MLKTSSSSIDGVIGSEFTLLPETSEKTDNVFERMVF